MITNCVITKNDYAGVDFQGGSAILAKSIIRRNQINGIYCHTQLSFPPPSVAVTNCEITGNGVQSGFAWSEIALTGGSLTLTSSTISGKALELLISGEGSAVVTNCILWGNSPGAVSLKGGQLTIAHSNIRGGWIGEGNTSLNPAFVDPENRDFHLKNSSPCIGSGKVQATPDTDIEGNPRPNPLGSNPDIGAYESPLAVRTAPSLDIFGMAADNEWVYEGTKEGNTYKVERKVTTDTSTFPIPTYAYEIKENGAFSGKEYYQKSADQVLLWGASIKDEGSLYDLEFSNGLPVIRFPAVVGDHQYSSTTGGLTQFPGYTFNVSMDVLVMTQETVDLGFDTFEAYKVRYEMRVWGQGLDYKDTFFWSVVPYIGAIKDEDANSVVKLTSFAIGEGTITHQSDTDRDNLRDCQEILKGQTNWLDGDTDDDGCLDGAELQVGRNPLIADSHGDVNGDCLVNIADAISALRPITGMDELWTSAKKADVNGDGRIRSEELIWILQRISGSR
jgi:hypothetical protein